VIINIKPVDVLFFRDSKPFGKGSEHFTKSIFPPYPQTLYGALRTKALETLGCDYEQFKNGNFVFRNQDSLNKIDLDNIKKEIGTVEKPGDFILKGPFLLSKNTDIYIKLPADVKNIGDDLVKKYEFMQPFNWSNFGVETDFELNNYPHIITKEPLEDAEGYIPLQKFTNYLLGKDIEDGDVKKASDVYDFEIRTGIGIDPQKNTTEEGLLYAMGFVRLHKDFSLCAEIENLSALPNSGIIKLGGANRICEYEELPDNPFHFYKAEKENIKSIVKEAKKFKLVFLTPALFNNGWISDKFNNYELQEGNVRIRLLTGVIGRAENISGWDLARNKPKPFKKLVPAGSVYYFELLQGDVGELFKKFNFVNFSDENPNSGFGLSIIGGIRK